jgi:hypothetical protein
MDQAPAFELTLAAKRYRGWRLAGRHASLADRVEEVGNAIDELVAGATKLRSRHLDRRSSLA